jgi:hypothetical protein
MSKLLISNSFYKGCGELSIIFQIAIVMKDHRSQTIWTCQKTLKVRGGKLLKGKKTIGCWFPLVRWTLKNYTKKARNEKRSLH